MEHQEDISTQRLERRIGREIRCWSTTSTRRAPSTAWCTSPDGENLEVGDAEGTLGLITAATLKLFPQPREQATAWVAVPEPAAAVALLGRLRDAAGDNVTAFEIIGRPALDLVLKHIPGRATRCRQAGLAGAGRTVRRAGRPRGNPGIGAG
jgi:FAD/FMN-containing dehydrogenase